MDFAYAPEDEAFRAELRAWLEDNVPKFFAEFGEEGADAEGDGDDDGGPAGAGGIMGAMDRRKAWQRRLNEGRWAAITWPKEWNGRDATVTQSVIYSEEMARAKAPGIFNANGLWQIGPMIIRWGTDEQKDRWLPTILDASTHWCQGFSEPQAGSDLANLRTVAVADGDDYVLNGQKIWIST
ncbi:MAG: acyl-CoA dehydrogenase family protein, partial [Actinobacteria bacterium]|nr:acyl-CoA dehydrogenase family protein [Actinomycetota bacterium]